MLLKLRSYVSLISPSFTAFHRYSQFCFVRSAFQRDAFTKPPNLLLGAFYLLFAGK